MRVARVPSMPGDAFPLGLSHAAPAPCSTWVSCSRVSSGIQQRVTQGPQRTASGWPPGLVPLPHFRAHHPWSAHRRLPSFLSQQQQRGQSDGADCMLVCRVTFPITWSWRPHQATPGRLLPSAMPAPAPPAQEGLVLRLSPHPPPCPPRPKSASSRQILHRPTFSRRGSLDLPLPPPLHSCNS